MTDKIKVLDFKKAPEETLKFPDQSTIHDMLLEKPLKGYLVITVNEEDSVSYEMAGVNTVEALGLLELTKIFIITPED